VDVLTAASGDVEQAARQVHPHRHPHTAQARTASRQAENAFMTTLAFAAGER